VGPSNQTRHSTPAFKATAEVRPERKKHSLLPPFITPLLIALLPLCFGGLDVDDAAPLFRQFASLLRPRRAPLDRRSPRPGIDPLARPHRTEPRPPQGLSGRPNQFPWSHRYRYYREAELPAAAAAAAAMVRVNTVLFIRAVLMPALVGGAGYAAVKVNWQRAIRSFATGPGRTSRLMLLFFVLTNLKNMPFAWTVLTPSVSHGMARCTCS
jgi:hypothetical protein